MANLSQYKTKRKFNQTKEPQDDSNKKSNDKIFVIQKHWASHLHFDFRLESEGVLKSWAVPKGVPNTGEKRLAMMVEDHPYDYKDFEGIIPKGNYGAGTVMVWDNGIYAVKGDASIDEKIKKGDFGFSLFGKKIRGEFSLVKIKKSEKNEWLLICKNREKININEELSVKSSLSKEEIEDGKRKIITLKGVAKTNKLPILKPMLASSVNDPFDDKKWIFEIKWDGYRILTHKQKNKISLYTRNGKDYSEIYADITKEISNIDGDFILDGEVIATDEKGNSSFQLLQNFLKDKRGTLIYYVFDILYFDGYDLRAVGLLERKTILQNLLENKNLKLLKISEFINENGKDLFRIVGEHKGEGIMAKKTDSIYKPGIRSKDWLKIKTIKTQDVIICGYTLPRGSRKKFGALVSGIWKNGTIRYSGHVGGGFDEQKLQMIFEKMKPLEIRKSPFETVPKTNMPVIWLKPKLIAEVKFSEWTQDGSMRHPIFLRLREDKQLKDATSEVLKNSEENTTKTNFEVQASALKVKLSNPDKIYWPEEGYTKKDLVRYYEKISKYILPYLKNRPQSLNRFPNGITGKNFFQKDVMNAPIWAKTVKIFSQSENKQINYLVCNDKRTLLYLANLGCIELNVWNSSLGALDKPDYMVFDLDPLEISFSEAIKVALEVKRILDEIGIRSYCKTSGSRGLHLYVPLKPVYSYEQVKEFAKLISLIVNQRLPFITSMERKPERRKNRIYLDYLQNREGQTMAAPYCLRPKKGAPVSTPLEWEELEQNLDPRKFNIKTIFQRLKKNGDPWKDFFKRTNGNLVEAIAKLEEMLTRKRNKQIL